MAGVTPDGHFDEEHCALYFVDLLHGLAHLHRHHIVHRDLKPEVCQNSMCLSEISLILLFSTDIHQNKEHFVSILFCQSSILSIPCHCAHFRCAFWNKGWIPKDT